VEELTPFEAYFADYQSSFEGLTNHILKALCDSVGFIAVLHPRGEVTYPGGGCIRASVWVEQEIAIAAYIAQITRKELKTAAFIHESVVLEGMRRQIILNPVPFSSSNDVLSGLKGTLTDWASAISATKAPARVHINSRLSRREGALHYYDLTVTATNDSVDVIDTYHLDVEIPLSVVEQGTVSQLEVPERRTATHALFRSTQTNSGRRLFPGDPVRLITLRYIVGTGTHELQSQLVEAKLYLPGLDPVGAQKTLEELRTSNNL
jgi:hypothetical protein